MPSLRALWVWLALIAAIVVAVGASVLPDSVGENTLVVFVVVASVPPVVVAVLGPSFGVLPLLGVAAAGYAAWFWLELDSTDVAAGSWFALFELWSVDVGWIVAGVLVAAATVSARRRARRRRDRQRARG
jgi:hypothetical protein